VGFDVTEVATGNDAATKLADVDDFDLVFTDIQTPGDKDGSTSLCALASFIRKSR
jgi:CheY-like chemotaxis protein